MRERKRAITAVVYIRGRHSAAITGRDDSPPLTPADIYITSLYICIERRREIHRCYHRGGLYVWKTEADSIYEGMYAGVVLIHRYGVVVWVHQYRMILY